MSRGAKVWAALWTVYVLWGSTYIGIAVAVETLPPILTVSLRFLLAGTVMAGWVLWRRGRGAFHVRPVEVATAVVVGILLPSSNAILFLAERDVPSGLASLIIAAVPLWVVVLRLAARDRPTRAALVGVLVGFAGVALLVRPGGDVGGATALGLTLTVVASFTWAIGSYVSSRLPMPRDAFAATAIEMAAGGLFLLPIGLLVDSVDPGSWSARSIVAFAYLVVFGSLVGFTAYVWLLANAPIGKVATYAYVNPVVAILLGALILHEHVTLTIVAGAAVIVASVAVVVRRETPAEVETSIEPAAAGVAPPHEHPR